MSLETDINQPVFSNDSRKGLINVFYTNNYLMDRMKLLLKRFDLSPPQFNILRILRGAKEPISTLQLRERMLERMSDTSRLVDRLIEKGWVEKKINPKDKRLLKITITTAGLKILAKIDKCDGEIDSFLGNLTEAELSALNNLLDKIRQHPANEFS